MKSTKVVFFGTSDRSLPILETLKQDFDLCLCVTKTNSKIGRDQIEKETEVKRWSRENKIEFVEVSSLKDKDLELVIKNINRVSPDIGIVADFSYIIPQEIIDALNGKIINIHFSLLPKYRGASPVQHAILNGDKASGVSFYLLDKFMDKGDILEQYEYNISSNITSGELYDELFIFASQKLTGVIENYLNSQLIPVPQDHSKATYTFSKTNPKHTFIFKEDALINWSDDPIKIERSIRAFSPWPISWSFLKDMEKADCLSENVNLKKSVNKDLKVKIFKSHIDNSKLSIDELQVEGKNKMSWVDFKNGYLDNSI